MLAVVGLVIGGIWVGARSVAYQRNMNETAENILLTVKAIKNMYHGLPCVDQPTIDVTALGIAPKGWPIDTRAGSPFLRSPTGSSIVFAIACGTAYGDIVRVSLGQGTWDFDQGECTTLSAKMHIKITGVTTQPSGDFITMGGSGYCSSATNASYIFSYR